jgi:hypothetical protein
VTPGPAQVSRLVFATPRVRNLLGLRNLEIRDLDKSSLDTVILGEPHLAFLPSGVIQIQSLYEGSRGPGAARLLGVTAFVNGRAGLAPDIDGAIRQALNEPPRIDIRPPTARIVVGRPVELGFDVQNGEKELVTITSTAGRAIARLALTAGRGNVVWVPSAPGDAMVRAEVTGLDGSVSSDSRPLRVFGPSPSVRLTNAPNRAVVGRPVHITFDVANGLTATARVSTAGGMDLLRHYDLRAGGDRFVEWTPTAAGPADLVLRVSGAQGQTASTTLHITVAPRPRPRPLATPTLTVVRAPRTATVGVPYRLVFRVAGSHLAVAEIAQEDSAALVWRFPRPPEAVSIGWTPSRPGSYRLTLTAAGERGVSTQTTTQVMVSDVEDRR